MCRSKYLVLAKCFDRKKRLISTAYNDYKKSSPVMKHFAVLAGLPEKEYWHSEVLALVRCKDKLPYRITVERYNKDGSQALAKPCPVCTLAICSYGVKVLEYTSSGGWVKEVLYLG